MTKYKLLNVLIKIKVKLPINVCKYNKNEIY